MILYFLVWFVSKLGLVSGNDISILFKWSTFSIIYNFLKEFIFLRLNARLNSQSEVGYDFQFRLFTNQQIN